MKQENDRKCVQTHLFIALALKKWGYTGFSMSFHNAMTVKLKCILPNNFYVCGPTSIKFIVHLVPKVSKV